MNSAEAADYIEQVLDAHIEGRHDQVRELLTDLVASRDAADSARVVCTLAAAIARSLHKQPGEDFYRFPTWARDPDGRERRISADDLSTPMATFTRMAVAFANDEPEAAMAMFLGFVDRSRVNAVRLAAAGLGQLAHRITCPHCCPPGWEWR